jgi:hypothetical protein
MRVEVIQRGGLAGNIALIGEVDSDELPPDQAEAAARALAGSIPGRRPAPRNYAHQLEYEFRFLRNEQWSEAAFDEDELPDTLRPLLRIAKARFKPAKAT